MDFIKNLENNSILIIPNNIKNKILDYIEENKLLINIKLLTFRDLKIGLLYDYNNEAIYHIMTKYNIRYDVAKNYINDTYFLTDENLSSEKIKHIKEIKDELENNNLLIKDKLFKNLISSKSKVYVYGFDHINKFNNHLLDLLKDSNEVIILPKEYNDYKHNVIELDTMEEEVIYVCENISKLIEQGIPLNKIFIANYSNEYYYTFHKVFSSYKIPYYIKSETKVYDTKMAKYFIDNLSNNMETLLYKLRSKFDTDNNEYANTIYTKISNLVNNYYWTKDYISVKELLIAELKRLSVPSNHYEEEIQTINLIDNVFNDDEYVFLIGFNLGSIPSIKKDEDYINDAIKTSLMEKSSETNTINQEVTLKVLKNIKNLTITYKNVSSSSEYFPSYLIDGNYLINKKENINYSNYSDDLNKLLYSSRLDELIKFNKKDNSLDILSSNYDIDYKTYSNKFTGLDKDKILSTLEKKKLSYSSISNYYKCPFKFYLNFLYRLDKYEQTLDLFIGSLFHKVMEECITDETKDIDQIYDEYVLKNMPESFKEKETYYIEKVRDEVHFIVENIRKQYEYSSHKDEWHEKEFTFTNKDLDLDVKVNYILTGFIDKVMLADNNCVIIDYKTGTSDKIDRDLFEFGLTVQLPIYMYLLKNSNKDINVVGMYLQHILEGLIRRDSTNQNKTAEQIRYERLRLDGLTKDDKTNLSLFDSNYESSNVISGMAITSKNEYRYKGRILTKEEEQELYTNIKTLLENAINDIADSKFDIHPINIQSKNVDGCAYCKYRDICFRNDSDVRYETITKKDGGEE